MVCMLMMVLFSCIKDEVGGSLKLDKVNKTIVGYLRSQPNFSILVDALDKTGLALNMNLYGSMTMFAPSNDAFAKFFTRKGISDLSGIANDELVTLLRYHLYSQQFTSAVFQTGSLPAVTASGDLIKMDISLGLKSTYLNNTVKIDTLDILVTNGVVHDINDVLEPSTSTIYTYMKGNPEYSIMSEAIHQTGLDATLLNKVIYDSTTISSGLPARKWITGFFETNNVLAISGITSFDDLAKKYSNSYKTTKNYTSPLDSLNIFVKYHCLQQKFFVSDFRDTYFETISSGDWLILSTKGGLAINKRGNIEVDLVLNKSNQVVSNGIIHSVDTVLSVYNPKPIITRCYFAGAPEDMVIKLKNGTVTTFNAQWSAGLKNQDIQDVIWWLKWGCTSGNPATPVIMEDPSNIKSDAVFNTLYPYDNPLERWMYRIQLTSPVGLWYELTTKPIFKGTYAVYLIHMANYPAGQSGTCYAKWAFDGVEYTDLLNMLSRTDAFGNEVLYWLPTGRGIGGWYQYSKRKLGVFTFDNIKSHKFKLTNVTDNVNDIGMCKLQFEPVF